MEPARVEVAREAARLFWIGGFLESLDKVRLAARDGGAARVDGRLWLAVPRAFHESFDARCNLFEAAPLESQLAVYSHD